MKAASGLEPLKAMYDAADAGKDELSVIDLGINPTCSLSPAAEWSRGCRQAW
jgi:hypothetical protein